MPKIAVIIPFVNEYPMIMTTIRSIGEELSGRVDFEVIAVDNWCKEVADQGRVQDRGHTLVSSLGQGIPWLKLLKYDKKLSHWQAKNLAVKNSTSPFLFFCDAHCIISRDALVNMLDWFEKSELFTKGVAHLPVTYHILEEKRLIYALRWFKEKSEVHYTFAEAPDTWNYYQVPCMSTCGMLMHRDLFELMGGWPEELGIYGGGENFMNFTLAVLGKKKWVFGNKPLYHHGEKRGYNWNFWDYERNRLIATYLFGGKAFASRFIEKRDKVPNKRKFWELFDDVIVKCSAQRSLIKKNQETDIESWADSMQALAKK